MMLVQVIGCFGLIVSIHALNVVAIKVHEKVRRNAFNSEASTVGSD